MPFASAMAWICCRLFNVSLELAMLAVGSSEMNPMTGAASHFVFGIVSKPNFGILGVPSFSSISMLCFKDRSAYRMEKA